MCWKSAEPVQTMPPSNKFFSLLSQRIRVIGISVGQAHFPAIFRSDLRFPSRKLREIRLVPVAHELIHGHELIALSPDRLDNLRQDVDRLLDSIVQQNDCSGANSAERPLDE